MKTLKYFYESITNEILPYIKKMKIHTFTFSRSFILLGTNNRIINKHAEIVKLHICETSI
jgi:hypothetical protein